MQFWNDVTVNQSELGQRIRQARERIGMTQEALAEAVERDQKAVSEYENGKRKLSATDLPIYARALGVDITYFFDGELHVCVIGYPQLENYRMLAISITPRHTKL